MFASHVMKNKLTQSKQNSVPTKITEVTLRLVFNQIPIETFSKFAEQRD